MKPPMEHPVSFRESLPPATREWLWLPRQTISLTGSLPHGVRTEFMTKHCPQQGLEAFNVGQIATGGAP